MGVVIIGGGQAGLQVAESLRGGGYTGGITVLADEAGLPYQRPPLSKDYLAPGKDPAPLPLRGRPSSRNRTLSCARASRPSPWTGPPAR